MNKRKKKSIFLTIAMILVVFIGGVSTAVHSSTGGSKVIIKLDDNRVWECKNELSDSWYTNTDKDITFKVNLRGYLNSDDDKRTELDAPFDIKIGTLNNGNNTLNDVTEYAKPEISKVEGEKGEFKVKFKSPQGLNNDNKLEIAVNFEEGNSWRIEKQEQKFKLAVDNVKPILEITNLAEIESVREFADPVSLKCKVNEENLSKVKIEILKTEYQGAAPKKIEREIDWNNKYSANRDYISFDSENDFLVNFNDDGYYEVKIALIDKAENINSNSTYKIYFQKNKFDYSLNISGANEVGANNYYATKNREVTVSCKNYFNMCFDGITYKLISENSTLEDKGKFVFGSKKFSFPSDGNYTLAVTVVKWQAINPFKNDSKTINYKITVDSGVPVISTKVNGVDTTLKNNDHDYFNDFKNIKMKISDSNLVSSSIEVYKEGQRISGTSDSLDLNANEQGLYEIYVRAKDIADNEAAAQYRVHIDKEPPVLEVKGIKNGEKIKKGNNESPILEISALDDNLNEAEATITLKRKGQDDEIKKVPLKNGAAYKYQVVENGTYSIVVTGNDKAGNVAKDKVVKFKRDTNAPKLTVKVDNEEIDDSKYTKDNLQYIKNEKGIKIDALVEEDYPKLNDDETVDEKSTYIKVKRTPVNQAGEEGTVIEGNEDYFSTEKSVTITEDGKYEVTIYSVDNCENETERTLFFVLDGTPPILTMDGESGYYVEAPNIIITSKDAFQEDGAIYITYIKTTKVLDKDDVIDKEETKEIKIDSCNKEVNLAELDEFNQEASYKILSIISKDKVGNVSDEKTVDYTIDNKAPTRVIEGVENGKHYSSEVTVKPITRDVNLESAVVEIFKDGEAYVPTADEIIDPLKIEEREASAEYKFTSDGEYKIVLKSEDKSGNGKGETEERSFVIDTTPPAISIDNYNDLNGQYISYNPILKVNITEKYLRTEIDKTYVHIIKKYADGTEDEKDYAFNLNGNCPDYSVMYDEFTKDGEYTVTVRAEDVAGNTSWSSPLIFTVDTTTPVQSISGVENDTYYNVDKNVELLSTDVNQNINIAVVTRDGEPYNIGEFTIEGAKAFLNYTFSGEGIYEILFTTTDKAQNTSISTIKFTIDKTAPDIKAIKGDDGSELKYGEYINRIFTPRFVLDKSEDFITQVTLNGADTTGNVSMASQEMEYNYSVTAQDKAGNVTTLDSTFTVDTTNPSISISGIMSGFFNEDLTPEFDITDTNLDYANTSSTLNGEAFTSGTKIEAQNDFNLKLVASDLASNGNSQSVSFTIDKDGPVISFKNPISGKYFTEDFIPEFLINDLTDYTIIALTLDGEEYHIGDIIEEEGKHVLYIEVMDKAGNTSELSVEFILDKTAPKFIIDGVEDGETYYDATSATIMLDNPLDKINSVSVNGESADGETIDEYGQQIIKLNFNDINDYEVLLNGTDEAGNITVEKLKFTVAEKTLLSKITKNKKILYSSAGVASAVVVIGIGHFALKRRKRLNISKVLENTKVEE